jgi:FK506-binding protein 4/5
VKYEARLEDGTVVSKSEGVEFTVKDGDDLSHTLLYMCILVKVLCSICCLLTNGNLVSGYFCPALGKAVKTMKKTEKVLLTVKPQCKLI